MMAFTVVWVNDEGQVGASIVTIVDSEAEAMRVAANILESDVRIIGAIAGQHVMVPGNPQSGQAAFAVDIRELSARD